MTRRLLTLGFWLTVALGTAHGHELTPAILTVWAGEDGGAARLTWSVPLLRGRPLLIAPEFAGCGLVSVGPPELTETRLVQRLRAECEGVQIAEMRLRVVGPESALADALAVVVWPGDAGSDTWALTATEAVRLRREEGGGSRVRAYFGLGFWHVLEGYDHLGFAVALTLLLTGWRRVVRAVTAFSVGHSLTLAAAAMGWVRPAGPAVETLIALSVVLLAREVVTRGRGRESLTARRPELIAGGFGLIHGLGFAGALAEFGLPEGGRVGALLLFNLGVEAGQLLVLAATAAATWALSRVVPRRWVEVAVATVIGGAGVWWVLA